MLETIGFREVAHYSGKDEVLELPKDRHRWIIADAQVRFCKTGRPNKQQRGQVERQKAKWMSDRFEEARKRRGEEERERERERERESAGNWMANIMQELKEEVADIERYALE